MGQPNINQNFEVNLGTYPIFSASCNDNEDGIPQRSTGHAPD